VFGALEAGFGSQRTGVGRPGRRISMDNRTLSLILPRLKDFVEQWELPWVEADSRRGRDPFRVLVACLLSLRTQENTTRAASERLFRLAGTPAEMIRHSSREIEGAIYPVGFYRTKAQNILALSRLLIEKYESKVPDTMEGLLQLKGVGRKTANLVLAAGYQIPAICVDTHVHRITNRWGYVRTKTPDETEQALRKKLPPKYWMEVNRVLVMFGQNWCKPISPKCTTCPIGAACPRIGVKHHR